MLRRIYIICSGIQALEIYLHCKQLMSQCTANTKQANTTNFILQ